jgi:N-sulfoglucosamine sulfohydrolase
MKYLFALTFLMTYTVLATDKPNILWIYAEDTSPWMGCYGDKINAGKTPHIDSMANDGVIFKRAFVPAPVCSATRSAMMVGQNSIRFGGHEHRSSHGFKLYLPKHYKLLPEIMREHGYNTFNAGKEDYNYVWDLKKNYNLNFNGKPSFKDLIKKQPFFGQIQTKGGKNNTRKFPRNRKVKPNDVTVPLDYPNNDIFKTVVAQHYDAIRKDDDFIGTILKGLKDAGLGENTIIVYFSDHGANNLLRHKQMTTEGGLHVPFVIKGPSKYITKKQVRNDLVNMLDLTATTLAWAGISQPEWYEGQNLFAKDFKERNFIGGQKDRLDHTIDRVRTIRTDKFRYVKNFKLDRIFLQPQYRDNKAYTKNLHHLYAEGKLSRRHKEIYFGERLSEELYDVSKDPHMMKNLVNNPDFENELNIHRKLMKNWLAKGDKGAEEESVEALKANGEGKKWGEGVNVEYEEYRQDSDGDGLSDKWETLNKRDPKDGRLYYEFNCGGWQNEGWKSDNIKSNLAGFLGYLDFSLDQKTGSITRNTLKVQAKSEDKSLTIKLSSDADIEVFAKVNKKNLGSVKVVAGAQNTYKITLNKNWIGEINSLELIFQGNAGTKIEIDSIEIER